MLALWDDRIVILLPNDLSELKLHYLAQNFEGFVKQAVGLYAVNSGYTCLYTTASALVIDLGAQESRLALQRKLKYYESKDFLIIDEIGYLSFDCKAADFIFEIVNRRYEKAATCITTNLAFKEWGQVFPGAPCVTAMIDRLTHRAKIIKIVGESHRVRDTKAKKEKANAGKGERWVDA